MKVYILRKASEFPEWKEGDLIPQVLDTGVFVGMVKYSPGCLTLSEADWKAWNEGPGKLCFYYPVKGMFSFRGIWSFKQRIFSQYELSHALQLSTGADVLNVVQEEEIEVIESYIESFCNNTQIINDLFSDPPPPPTTLHSGNLDTLLQKIQSAIKQKTVKVNWILSSKGITYHEV